jgi:DNA-binding NarL/FixJ family response regulator
MMDDGDRGAEARSVNESNLPGPLSVADDAGAHRFEAPQRGGFVGTRADYWLPVENKAIAIAVVDEHSFTRECIARSLQECDDGLDVEAYDGCDACITSGRTYDLILFHAHAPTAARRNEAGEERATAFSKMLDTAPVIVLSDSDRPEAIIAAFESGARGYIPTADTSLGLALEIVRLVKAGGTFVPPSGLALRRPSRHNLPPPAAPAADETFTPRQMAVLRHLKLGKANKTIARELEMSESTVKIHLRNIMKKMNAANRTEVACRAHALELQYR